MVGAFISLGPRKHSAGVPMKSRCHRSLSRINPLEQHQIVQSLATVKGKGIDKNIWIEQPLKCGDLEFGTKGPMILHLTDGGLLVISSDQEISKTTIYQISMGKVTFVVAPNLYHHLFTVSSHFI